MGEEQEGPAVGDEALFGDVAGLIERFGRGYTYTALTRMVKFAEWIDGQQIVAPLAQQLTWTNITEILALSDRRQREFYAATCARERWSKRTLRERIASQLYERTLASAGSADALAARMEALTRGSGDGAVASVDSDEAAALVPRRSILLRDPYVLDFLGLPSEHSEADLERALLDQMQRFLLELGAGFAFVQRQKRMTVDGRDYRLDLLMYHIHLRCYVAIELKSRPLEPGDFGQMTLYLRWLAAYENREGDAAPLGIVLCSKRGPEQVRLMGLDEGEVRAASYVLDPVRASLERALEK